MEQAGGRAVTVLPNDPSAVPAARRFASQQLIDFPGASETVDKTRLLVTELTTNAVVHAHSPIRLTVEPIDGRIRVEVRDDDPTPLDAPRAPDPDATSGRGLWLVAALAYDWGINRNERGKTIWFEVD
jgi:anti-sigma regulatory factor (Ser/Thr protein kinase)